MDAVIPKVHRPFYDGLEKDEAIPTAVTAELKDLQIIQEDGLTFAEKTAMWVAYERNIESQRGDGEALFRDPLAQFLHEPYGQRLSDCFAWCLMHSVFDPITTREEERIGLGYEGHVMYTAARTHLINLRLTKWLQEPIPDGPKHKQVVNLGAGLDTRAFWLESLTEAALYWEVDTPKITRYKEEVLDKLKSGNQVPDSALHLVCERKVVAMDFSNASILDLPSKYGFGSLMPTGWILEGLIMYLKSQDVVDLLQNVSNLSSPQSYLILNFANNITTGLTVDEIDEQLVALGWKCEDRLMFGDTGFNFGRYPANKPSNKVLGFAFYEKIA